MSGRGFPTNSVPERAVAPGRRPSLRKLSAYVGFCLGAIILTGAVLILLFGGAVLNGYGKNKAEQAFAKAYPGCALQIGRMDYSVRAHRLIAQSVTLRATNTTLKLARLVLTDVRWARLFFGSAPLSEVLAQASMEVTNLDWEFPRAGYVLHCARVRASVPGSELIADATELRPLLADEAFFAAHGFRTTRFHLIAPECRVLGLAYGELLRGKAYRARSVRFSRPAFDVLVDRDKPREPFVKPPLMVQEALATIRQPLQIGSLMITDGSLKYGERVVAGADPGVLTFGAVAITVQGIANGGDTAAVIRLRAQGDFMNAGLLKVLMTIPVNSPDFSFHYSGSLSAMDLTRLNAFVDIAEHTRITSGSADAAAFDIDVAAGRARGRVRAIYQNLEIAVLDKRTGSEKRFDNRIASFLANTLKIRNANGPGAPGAMKEGKVDYTRRPADEFLQFMWAALWSGIVDISSH
jgi:hypothetical protein